MTMQPAMTLEQFQAAMAEGRKLWNDIVAADRLNFPEAYKGCGHRRCPCEMDAR